MGLCPKRIWNGVYREEGFICYIYRIGERVRTKGKVKGEKESAEPQKQVPVANCVKFP